jgi:hypothetical protein
MYFDRFFKEIHSTPCEHEIDGELCEGEPVMRRMKYILIFLLLADVDL